MPVSNCCAFAIMSMKHNIIARNNYEVLSATDTDTDGCVWRFLNFIYTHPHLDIQTVINDNMDIFYGDEDKFWNVFKALMLTDTIDMSTGDFRITNVGKISFIMYLKTMQK